MKAKKLIEVALPIKEISAESVRDKYIHHGHISTLHIWWARRPLPLCRAAIFASLVPDPLDDNCPQAFRDAVKALLDCDQYTNIIYRPYKDIPYTAIYDPMEDNLRHRLMMFIGKFSDECAEKMLKGETTSQKDQISDYSLIKWENKNNPKVINIARELIFIAHNAEANPLTTYSTLHTKFDELYGAIKKAEVRLYSIPNRHLVSDEVEKAESNLQQSIINFQQYMPNVLDPFAGGGAIPLEAARLGCRSYGNDINPVAHIIERSSAEFPQKYGKPLKISYDEFILVYGESGLNLLREKNIYINKNQLIEIPNRLSFDVEYYAKELLVKTEKEFGEVYTGVDKNKKPVAYYWTRTVKCCNPSCQATVPMLKQFYLSNKSSKKIYLSPIINGNEINFELKEGTCSVKSWNNRGNITCPCCGSLISIDLVKQQSVNKGLGQRLLCEIYDDNAGKRYEIPTQTTYVDIPKITLEFDSMHRNSGGGDTFSWGITQWSSLFTERQLFILDSLSNNIKNIIPTNSEYYNVIKTYLAILVNRVVAYSTSFGRWIPQNEQLTSLFGRQAIAMNSDYPEMNIFSKSTSGAYNQLEWIVRYLESECDTFYCTFANASSGEKEQFKKKELTAVVTDPPYYNAIAYADNSDFFYLWFKKNIGDIYPLNFATPQTPKAEECTALKHHHNNSAEEAKNHFENKLTQIFDAIERQTSGVVSIMFAHQSTEAWTTLCNSILDARMNITGSWAIDSERDTRMIANSGAALESSVTVACRPSERDGFADFKEVKRDIENKVATEIEKLYELGYRGADLLTACFGQAVSEFGKYEAVEKSNGDEVTVAELLEMARQTAFDSLLKGVQGDELTRFYIGWLQMNGVAETDFDDATKFTRVGVNIEIREVLQKGLLIQNQTKYKVAMSDERPGMTHQQGTRPDDPLIDQAHRLIKVYKEENRAQLLYLIENLAPDATSPLWRLLATLKELLPANDELKQVQGLLVNAESLRQDCHKTKLPEQGTLFDNI